MIRWGCWLSQIGSREFCAPLLVRVGFLLFIAVLPSVSSALDPPERRARGATSTVQPVQRLAPGQRALPMWEVTRFDHPDSVLYVIAELDYGRQPVTELPSAIERVFDSADTLIVSVDDLRPGFAERVASAVDRNRWLRRKKLPDLLDESTHAGLRSLLVGAGQEGDSLDSFRPWYAQGWVEWTFCEGRGFDEQYSLHRELLARAVSRRSSRSKIWKSVMPGSVS
ncbi:MAG: TraB/GumN family protein [bacterium]|nr:TraB/GumN family protein [bacterium]